jgi:hypothetical protein
MVIHLVKQNILVFIIDIILKTFRECYYFNNFVIKNYFKISKYKIY